MEDKKHNIWYYLWWAIKLNIWLQLDAHIPDLDRSIRLSMWFDITAANGSPKHCYKCGHDYFKEGKHDYINEGQVCEYSLYCTKCGVENGHWAYGNWCV